MQACTGATASLGPIRPGRAQQLLDRSNPSFATLLLERAGNRDCVCCRCLRVCMTKGDGCHTNSPSGSRWGRKALPDQLVDGDCCGQVLPHRAVVQRPHHEAVLLGKGNECRHLCPVWQAQDDLQVSKAADISTGCLQGGAWPVRSSVGAPSNARGLKQAKNLSDNSCGCTNRQQILHAASNATSASCVLSDLHLDGRGGCSQLLTGLHQGLMLLLIKSDITGHDEVPGMRDKPCRVAFKVRSPLKVMDQWSPACRSPARAKWMGKQIC